MFITSNVKKDSINLIFFHKAKGHTFFQALGFICAAKNV